jgi:hypothetical protein
VRGEAAGCAREARGKAVVGRLTCAAIAGGKDARSTAYNRGNFSSAADCEGVAGHVDASAVAGTAATETDQDAGLSMLKSRGDFQAHKVCDVEVKVKGEDDE